MHSCCDLRFDLFPHGCSYFLLNQRTIFFYSCGDLRQSLIVYCCFVKGGYYAVQSISIVLNRKRRNRNSCSVDLGSSGRKKRVKHLLCTTVQRGIVRCKGVKPGRKVCCTFLKLCCAFIKGCSSVFQAFCAVGKRFDSGHQLPGLVQQRAESVIEGRRSIHQLLHSVCQFIQR